MSAPVDEARLNLCEERANAATPGEWIGDGELGFVFQRGASRANCIARLDHEDVRDTSGADLAFIAHARTDVPDLVAEVRRLTAALATARREGAEEMREAVKAEIHAAFHYNDPPDDGVERPIGPIQGQREAHQTLRRLLSRVCAVLTEGGAT